MRHPLIGPAILFLAICINASSASAAITNVNLGTSPASPQLVGTTITLTASATDSDPGPLSYKWEVQLPGTANYRVMRDFDMDSTFIWVPNYREGKYSLRLTARDYLAGTSAQQVIQFTVKPLVTADQPIAVATANPLVALFSSPNCPAGSTMAVVFQLVGSSVQTVTDNRPCHPGSQNFYIGGMQPNQQYTMYGQVTTNGTVTPGPQVTFTTGALPVNLSFPVSSVPVPPAGGADTSSGIVFSAYDQPPNFPIATDLEGNIVWYYSETLQMTRPVPGGTFLGLPNGDGTGTSVWGTGITRQQLLREFDLAGNVVRETNCDRVYEQLQALGMTDPVGRFNHDAIRLSNGQTMVIADVQRIFPAGTQGSAVPIDIIGDVIVLLDTNFQVVSYWNAFDHDCSGPGCIDINKPGDSTCAVSGDGSLPLGCPPALLSSPANDWLHINSLQFLSSDGDLLASVRNQDWIAKIDYQRGAGSGAFLWLLGLGGNFTLVGTGGEPYPWFSGQHNPSFVDNGEQTLVVFDNGTTRHKQYLGDSRGQVWHINQNNMTASLRLNADLGFFSPALGSAQVMENGDIAFFAGDIYIDANDYQVLNTEYSTAGAVEYQYQATGPANAYRGWRLPSLYQSTLNGSGGPE